MSHKRSICIPLLLIFVLCAPANTGFSFPTSKISSALANLKSAISPKTAAPIQAPAIAPVQNTQVSTSLPTAPVLQSTAAAITEGLSPYEKAKRVAERFLGKANLESEIKFGDTKTCQGAWARTGSVCKKDKVLAMLNLDKGYLTDYGQKNYAWNVDRMKKLANYLSKGRPKGFSLNKEQKKKIMAFLDTKRIPIRKANNQKCFAALIKLKNSAMCSICSGENYIYFDNDIKGLFPQQECNNFLSACEAHFEEFVEMHEAFLILADANQALNPKNPMFVMLSKGFAWGLKLFSAYSKFLNSRVIAMTTATSLKEKQRIGNAYCERMIKFGPKGATWLPVSFTITSFNLFLIASKVFVIDPIGALSNWRMLQALPSDPSALFANTPSFGSPNDIRVVQPSDSIFTFEGQKGTSQQQDHTHHKPMNMSLEFL